MLGDEEYADVVAWSAAQDSFIVKDMNEFTTRILPQTFRHSNFASFVRQLNKYDFHKVRTTRKTLHPL
jgi:osomolarity two-component system response regulator SKN7